MTLQFYASPSDVVTLTTYTPTGSTSKLVTMPHVGIYEMATTTVVVPNAASVRFVASTPEGNSATVWYKTSHYVPPPLYAVSLTKVRTAPTYAVLQTSGCTGKVTCVVQRKLPTGWVDYLKITSVPFKTVRGLTIRVKGTAPGAVVYSTAVAT